MPNGEAAPQADGQMVTVANIDQITKGDGGGQKVSSHLTLSGQRSLKEEVQERVARIQADMSTLKDAQLRLADDLFWLLDPVFKRFKQNAKGVHSGMYWEVPPMGLRAGRAWQIPKPGS